MMDLKNSTETSSASGVNSHTTEKANLSTFDLNEHKSMIM